MTGRNIEVWGGVECTVNRVGNRYRDQLASTGHADRLSDLDLFAKLGLRTLRYPVLWERVAPSGLSSADWRWTDERLQRLRELGIDPIVGLVHHGSGPRYTSLVDPAFGEKLEEFALAVARRYPWVTKFTPVNEPVTTARFSGLYGQWFPHGRDDSTFARILVNECKGISLAMRAIRSMIPGAELVQTDDSGRTYASEPLEYQATFENQRRWLAFDLILGRVNEQHPLWGYLIHAGLSPDELSWFGLEPCRLDTIGLNYYVTSDRFLDLRTERYPQTLSGGNGRHRYVDIEAVRVRPEGLYGHRAVMFETWRRYGLPVACTEVQLGCSREEQLRWLSEAWAGAIGARRMGADVRAVTAWSLLGATDWDSLVTEDRGHYEPGAFDVRGPAPRRTALAKAISQLTSTGDFSHPVLDTPGWWRRPSRLVHGAGGAKHQMKLTSGRFSRPVIIAGATGTLGQTLSRACAERGLDCRLLRRQDIDVTDPTSVKVAFARYRPWAMINAAGYGRVDEAEGDAGSCYRENITGPVILARYCNSHGVAFLTFSSDLVFDGAKRTPYIETDEPNPLSVYGYSMAEAEWRVLTAMPRALIVRTCALFGPSRGEYNFATLLLRTLVQRRLFAVARDATVSPTYAPDLASAALDLLIDGTQGIWHLANEGSVSWFELALSLASAFGLDTDLIEPVSTGELALRAQRPAYSALASSRGKVMPTLADAICRYSIDRSELDAVSHSMITPS